MKKKTKVKDRFSEDPEDNTYIHGMPLPKSRVWFRYRGIVVPGVKADFKNSHINNLSCKMKSHIFVCYLAPVDLSI